LRRERRNIKTLFLSFLFGLVIALISFGFWSLLSGSLFRWELVLLLGVFNMSWLKYLFLKLNIDLTDFGRKGWFGSYTTYFFTWLMVLIVLVNPPFYDDEPPVISVVALPEIQEPGGTIKIVARVIDNAGVEKCNLSLTFPNLSTVQIEDFIFEDDIILYTFENSLLGNFTLKIVAVDVNGLTSQKECNFSYDEEAIKMALPPGVEHPPGPLVTYASTIKFDVKPKVSRVYYRVDGGKEINATLEKDFYETSPKYEGWIKNKNVTVRVYADVIHYFENLDRKFNNTLVDSSLYFLKVGAEGIGEEPSPEITLPKYTPISIPGFEILIFIISLILVIKKKK
jgi:hypothetical protein